MAAVAAPVRTASADPAPVESFAPPPPVLASADSMIRTVELPMPQRNANGVVPVTELPSPAPAPLIKADAASYRHAPRVASEATRPAQREATALVRHLRRSVERRVGKEGVSKGRLRGS